MSPTEQRHTVVCQKWLESELGWGERPDGCSLHLTEEDRKLFCKEYWDYIHRTYTKMPYEYSREDGHPKLIDIDHELYVQIKQSNCGVRLSQVAYNKLL